MEFVFPICKGASSLGTAFAHHYLQLTVSIHALVPAPSQGERTRYRLFSSGWVHWSYFCSAKEDREQPPLDRSQASFTPQPAVAITAPSIDSLDHPEGREDWRPSRLKVGFLKFLFSFHLFIQILRFRHKSPRKIDVKEGFKLSAGQRVTAGPCVSWLLARGLPGKCRWSS